MTTVSVTDLTNAKTDVDHIAAIATSTALTATDRLGTTKKTLQGAINSISAITDRGAWVTATAYAVKDIVLDTGVYYICITAHTSGATFAGDSAKWRVYQGDLGAYHSVDVVNDIRSNDFSSRKMIRIATERGNPVYYLDSSDTVSADDDFLVVHDSASNRWKLVHNGTIDVRWAGAVGDGITDDVTSISSAYTYCSSKKVALFFPDGTYVVSAQKSRSFAGGTLYCAVDLASNTHVYCSTKHSAVIKLKDNESTDASPRNIVMFFSNVFVEKLSFTNIKFDMNGTNNLISPNRGIGTYNRYLMAPFIISGDNIYCTDVEFKSCAFVNSPGTSCIGTGQSNLVGSTLSQNILIDDCLFYNNGLDTDDHSSVYMWAENARCVNSTFEQPIGLDKTGRNWVTYEIHGANQWFVGNTVKNYYRGCWIASNYTNAADNIWVTDNEFNVWGLGPSLFRQAANQTIIKNVHIARNNIHTDNTVTALAFKGSIECNVYYRVENVFIYDNSATFELQSVGNSAFLVAGAPVGVDTHGFISVKNNKSTGGQIGVFVRTYATGTTSFEHIEEHNNTWDDLKLHVSGISVGSYYISDAANPIQKLKITDNTYKSTATATGIRCEGTYGYLEIDRHSNFGVTASPALTDISITITTPANVTKRKGKQLNTGAYGVMSTIGVSTWDYGDLVYCYNPTRTRNISYWQHLGVGSWRAHGTGNGTTAERPTLSTYDAGYAYFDTTLAKLIVWDGSAWLV